MNRKTIGWLLLIAGAGIQLATGFAQGDANLTGVTADQTSFGAVIAPLQKLSPVPVGYALMGAGALLLWVMPE